MSISKNVIGELSLKSGVEHKIEWTIGDFRSYTVENEKYASPDFTVSGSKWYLSIYPRGDETRQDSPYCTSLYLCKAKGQNYSIVTNYILDVKNADKTLKNVKKGDRVSHVFNKDGEEWGYPKFLSWSDMMRDKSKLIDTLTVVCLLKVEDYLNPISRQEKLSARFEDLFISKKFCDVTLKVRDEEFSAHRFILSAQSPVFAAMFEVEMQEKTSGVVEFVNCDPKVFKDFLFYLYSSKCKDFPNNVYDLYRIAHKYDVEDLMSSCVLYIVNNLTLENLYDAVIFGDEYGEQEAKVKTQEFFMKNLTDIVDTEKWNSFLKSNCRLTNELLKSLVVELNSKKCTSCQDTM